MQNQHGFILIIVLLFLMLCCLLTIAALDSSNKAQKLAGFQQQHLQLFIAAEHELALGEKQIIHHMDKISLATRLITDQQLRTNQIPREITKNCELRNNYQQCYYLELIARQQCLDRQVDNPVTVNFYRISIITKNELAITQQIILQSTFVLMPKGFQYCELVKGEPWLIYAGRQSWREI